MIRLFHSREDEGRKAGHSQVCRGSEAPYTAPHDGRLWVAQQAG